MKTTHIYAISVPYPDGQRVTALALEYSETLKQQPISPEAFAVEGRRVVKAYVSDRAKIGKPSAEGRFVLLELDPTDPKASTLLNLEGQHLGEEHHGGPGGPGRGPGGGGPRERVLPDGRVYAGPSGLHLKREPLALRVKQLHALESAAGAGLEPWQQAAVSDKEINKWADLFCQKTFEDIEYNLFVPENYDPAQKYPLVLFIHDAGAMGASPRIALEQGLGATIFAAPEQQKKHPCIVVAPQHAKELAVANDRYWCLEDLHTYKRLLDQVQAHYSVDADRIYTTGQSMGFMTSLQLMIEYPDYFAAGLVPAGHWDVERTARLWRQNLWMFLSEEDKGGRKMFALPQAVEKLGGHMGVYYWDANQPTAALSRLVNSTKNDGNTFHLTIFPGNSIARPDQPDRTNGGGHNGTWHLVYQIEAARDWLFEQRRGAFLPPPCGD